MIINYATNEDLNEILEKLLIELSQIQDMIELVKQRKELLKKIYE